jgi:hypothetical protein
MGYFIDSPWLHRGLIFLWKDRRFSRYRPLHTPTSDSLGEDALLLSGKFYFSHVLRRAESILPRMGRELSPMDSQPPATCDRCGGHACTLDQAGIVCYRCGAGIFMHRRFWRYLHDPWRGYRQFFALPDESVTEEEVAAEMAKYKARALAYSPSMDLVKLKLYDRS